MKLLTRTARGTLPEAAATEMSLRLDKRFIRPCFPGNVRINGRSCPAAVAGEIAITWATRNRQSRTACLVRQTEGAIFPELNQTTTVRLYNENGALVRTESGLTSNGYTWPLAQEATDSGLGRVNASLKVEVEASRADHQEFDPAAIEEIELRKVHGHEK